MVSEATPADADTDPPSALPRGTHLGEFELRRVIGAGGFGIVYLALDHTLEREVAVKEYMPSALVGRTETLHLSLRSKADADTFELGRRSFVNEAKLLARFDHPSLLKVYRYWEANGTAYMAMPVLAGPTLRDIRNSMREPPTEAWVRTTLLLPLLGAIERLHGAGVYHRDIAPDNIVVEPDGRPVLLDFGAARHVIGDKTHALTAILKPSYAPLEQYAEAGALKQGPWTDIYALGATLHFVLLGKPPLPATVRALSDDHTPLAGQGLPGVSQGFLRVLDWMLEPRPADRPQSVAALRAVLDGSRLPPPVPPATHAPRPSDDAWQPTLLLTTQADGVASGFGSARADDAVPSWDGPPAAGAPPSQRGASRARAQPSPHGSTQADAQPLRRGSPQADARPSQRGSPQADARPSRRGSNQADARPSRHGSNQAGTALSWRRWPLPWLAAGGAAAALLLALVLVLPRPKVAAPVAVVVAPAASPVAATTPAASAPSAAAPAVAIAAEPARVELAAPRPQPRATMAQRQPTRAAADEARAPAAETPPPPAEARPRTPDPPPQQQPQQQVQSSPAERCSGRLLVALWMCIDRECGKPELRAHPECVRWRAEQDRRANQTQ